MKVCNVLLPLVALVHHGVLLAHGFQAPTTKTVPRDVKVQSYLSSYADPWATSVYDSRPSEQSRFYGNSDYGGGHYYRPLSDSYSYSSAYSDNYGRYNNRRPYSYYDNNRYGYSRYGNNRYGNYYSGYSRDWPYSQYNRNYNSGYGNYDGYGYSGYRRSNLRPWTYYDNDNYNYNSGRKWYQSNTPYSYTNYDRERVWDPYYGRNNYYNSYSNYGRKWYESPYGDGLGSSYGGYSGTSSYGGKKWYDNNDSYSYTGYGRPVNSYYGKYY